MKVHKAPIPDFPTIRAQVTHLIIKQSFRNLRLSILVRHKPLCQTVAIQFECALAKHIANKLRHAHEVSNYFNNLGSLAHAQAFRKSRLKARYSI